MRHEVPLVRRVYSHRVRPRRAGGAAPSSRGLTQGIFRRLAGVGALREVVRREVPGETRDGGGCATVCTDTRGRGSTSMPSPWVWAADVCDLRRIIPLGHGAMNRSLHGISPAQTLVDADVSRIRSLPSTARVGVDCPTG